MTITKATGQSSLVAGSWHDVTLGHEGLTLLSKALAMDAAHGDAYAVVTPEQQVSILYAGAPFWGKKLADPQLDSLSYFQDELAELRDVRTGADTLAAMAAPADPPELTVEKQAFTLAEQLGLDVSKMRKLPRVAGGGCVRRCRRRCLVPPGPLSSATPPVRTLPRTGAARTRRTARRRSQRDRPPSPQ